jgi:hypothetical protein
LSLLVSAFRGKADLITCALGAGSTKGTTS